MATDASLRYSDPESLRGAIRSIGRSWPIIILCAIVAVVATLAYSTREKSQYTAAVSLSLNNDPYQQVVAGGYNPVDAQRELQSAAAMIALPLIAQRVARRVGAPAAGSTSVAPMVSSQSDLFQIVATSPRPEDALSVANATGREFLRYRRQLSAQTLAAARQVLAHQISTAPTRGDRRVLLGKLNNLSTLKALQDSHIQILQRAVVGAQASSRHQVRTGLIALILGLLVGVSIALLRSPRRPVAVT